MNVKNELQKYLAPSNILKGLIAIFTTLLVGCLALAMLMGKNEKKEPVVFDPYLSEGTYAYVDLVGIDDVVCINNGNRYYTGIDSDFYFINIVLTDSQFKKLQTQYDYYYNDDPYSTPTVKRLYGIVKQTNRSVREMFVDYYSDLYSVDDYYNYFGECYLDTTASTATNTQSMWLTLALITGLFDLLFIVTSIEKNLPIKKSIKRLTESEMQEALEQINEAEDDDKKLLLTSDYAISKSGNFVAKYNDIIWAYKKVVSYYFIFKQNALVLKFSDKSEANVMIKDNGIVYDSIFQALKERNPQILIGYNDDNRRIYKQLVK